MSDNQPNPEKARVLDDVFVDLDVPDTSDLKKKITKFSGLLEDIENLDIKIRNLWIQIYENAITDRSLAHVNLAPLMKLCFDKPELHGLHGPVIAKYMERMEKATNQIIKLAEMVEEYKRNNSGPPEEELTPEEIYSKINSKVSKPS